MFKKILYIIVIATTTLSQAQVGVNTTSPKALLDVEASNRATPSNTDGFLIPRIDAFPTANPTIDQQGMLVYLTTQSGTNIPGIYMWNNAASSWVSINRAVTNLLEDTDQDTKIDVEETVDEDIIRFDVEGTERMFLDNTGLVYTGNYWPGGNVVDYGQGARMTFSTGKASFRVGQVDGNHWNNFNVGEYSFASGYNTIASGWASTSAGFESIASGAVSFAVGDAASASGHRSVALGQDVTASAVNSFAINNGTIASGLRSFSSGLNTTASGVNSFSAGSNTISSDLLEFSIGRYNINGTGASNGWNSNDNLFNIGNGTNNATRSNAFQVQKNGNTFIQGTLKMGGSYAAPNYEIVNTDGVSGQVLTTDGAGNVTWQTNAVTGLQDADADTKIQVEKNADEDIIRFDIGGVEHFIMNGATLEVVNTGNSVFIGSGAGVNDDFSNNANTFMGNQAGNANTSGALNSAFGNESLLNNVSGTGNTAVGYRSQSDRVSGNTNSSFGSGSLESNINGVGNVALGFDSLTMNTTGNSNLAIGYLAGRNNLAGNRNIFIGYQAGNFNTGSSNVFLGYRAGRNANGASNKLFIENTSSSTPLIYGEFDNDILRINGELQIGTAFSFPVVDGTNSQVLSTDGAGNVTWQNSAVNTDNQQADKFSLNGTTLELSLQNDGVADYTVDLSSLNAMNSAIQDADADTKIQVEKNADDDIIRFDIEGTERWIMRNKGLENINSGGSLFIGAFAGISDDNSNNFNTFIGQSSGSSISTASFGAYLGAFTGQYSTGANNTFFGYQSGRNNFTGVKNTFLGGRTGLNSKGSGNVFLGYQAGTNEIGSNKFYVENSVSASPLIYGEFDNNILRINGELQIGTAFSLPVVDGTNGQVLKTDGAGNVTWQSNAITSLQDADADTKIQVEETPDEDIIRFDLSGTEHFVFQRGRIGIPNSSKNISIGALSGFSMSGQHNTYLGNRAGNSSTSSHNVVVGAESGLDIRGVSNTMIGSWGMIETVTGMENVGLGSAALQNLRSGSNNTALGVHALRSNRHGGLNVALGASALRAGNGGKNVAVGGESGRLATGNLNVYLGYNSGLNATGDNKLYIENTDSDTPLIYGEFDNDMLRINGELQIGTAFSLPVVDGTSSQVLSTDGSGNVSWQNSAVNTDNQQADKFSLNGTTLELSLQNDGVADYTVDLSSLNAMNSVIQDTDGDTKIQVEETADEDIIRFDVAGTEYFSMKGSRLEVINTGNSIFIGRNAGLNDDLTNNVNLFVGEATGRDNTVGTFNVGLGQATLLKNVNGDFNIGVGLESLKNNISGDSNSALGHRALESNTAGNLNVAVGFVSGNNSTGNNNVFLGSYAGFNQTSGSKNIIIGTHIDADNLTGSSQLNIGGLIKGDLPTGALSIADDFKVTGNGSLLMKAAGGSFDVGITQNSSVVGGAATMELTTTDGISAQATRLLLRGNSDDSDIEFYRGASGAETQTMHIEGTSGNVGIGTNSPTQARLVVNGSVTTNQTYGFLNPNGSTGTATATGNYSIWASDKIAAASFNAISDARVKNIEGVSNTSEDLENLMNVKVTNYTMKDTVQYGTKSFKKVIAQELDKVYPQAVTKTATNVIPNIYKIATIDNNGFIALSNSGLVIGDKIKLIAGQSEDIAEIITVNPKGFSVNTKLKGEVFVYGKQVNDFHTVNYEAISMLNVSATQELYKTLKKQQAELENLKNEHSKLASDISEIKAILKQKHSKD